MTKKIPPPQPTVRRHPQRRSTATLALAACVSFSCWAQQPGQRTFPSAEEASSTLAAAARNNDEKALIDLLGADGKTIIQSGDGAEDIRSRAQFTLAYQEMHRLVAEPDGTTTLYIGSKNWPTPIPLVQKAGAWYFDTPAAKKEILYRRVGRNEMSAVRICQELAAAQAQYHQRTGAYAEKIASAKGLQDGLYWDTSASDAQSPIGPLVAAAVAESKESDSHVLRPYRGYYFRVLTAQGNAAPGGAKSYLTDGKMTAGFGFLAFPAEYRSSGVMTFMVGTDGVIYEKDLGPKTSARVRGIKQFDPDATWHRSTD